MSTRTHATYLADDADLRGGGVGIVGIQLAIAVELDVGRGSGADVDDGSVGSDGADHCTFGVVGMR